MKTQAFIDQLEALIEPLAGEGMQGDLNAIMDDTEFHQMDYYEKLVVTQLAITLNFCMASAISAKRTADNTQAILEALLAQREVL